MPTSVLTRAARGALAGAAGTTALNAVTYLDMLARGRPASETPEETVEKASDGLHVRVPGSGQRQDNRVSALGALLGLGTGVAVGALYGVSRALGFRPPLPVAAASVGVAAMLASNGPMAALRVTDPRGWSFPDWVADALPHLAYGLVTASAAADGERTRR